MKYDGIEVHNRFEEFPEPVDNVAIARHKNHLSGYGGSWDSSKKGGEIFSEHPEERGT